MSGTLLEWSVIDMREIKELIEIKDYEGNTASFWDDGDLTVVFDETVVFYKDQVKELYLKMKEYFENE